MTPEAFEELKKQHLGLIEHARLLAEKNAELATRAAAAERDAHKWKANHDNQVKMKRALSQRPDLAPLTQAIQKLVKDAFDEGFLFGEEHEMVPSKYPPRAEAWHTSRARRTVFDGEPWGKHGPAL